MALPDISGLTPDELHDLAVEATMRRTTMQTSADANRATFTAEVTSTGIGKVEAVAATGRSIKAMTNADVAANVGRLLKDVAQGQAILARQVAILQHLVANDLDSTDLPAEA